METVKKKILILGAGDAQLNLIESAQKLNYYTIVCDMRSAMKGSKIADKYYQEDYMDREAVLKIAYEEKIDGVISNSESAMKIVSYLVEKLGLPGNSIKSIENLQSKSLFRALQKQVGLFSPNSFSATSAAEALAYAKIMRFPIIIKPSECSGSRGATRIDNFSKKDIIDTFKICQDFSRNDLVTMEEYVEMESLEVINADVFVVGDEIIWDGWYGGLRSIKYPMIPMAKVLPPNLPETRKTKVINDVNILLKASGVRLGEFNVETFFTMSGELFIIEINARQAGDDIPNLIKEHTGVDLTRLLVSLTVDDRSYYNYLKTYKRKNDYITLQVVFSDKSGRYEGLYIDDRIRPFIKWVNEFCIKGEQVYAARNAEDSVAYVGLKFNTLEEQEYFTIKIEDHIKVIVK